MPVFIGSLYFNFVLCLAVGFPLVLALKGLCHAILGNFGTDQLVIKLTEI